MFLLFIRPLDGKTMKRFNIADLTTVFAESAFGYANYSYTDPAVPELDGSGAKRGEIS